jgi:hypothetical protein
MTQRRRAASVRARPLGDLAKQAALGQHLAYNLMS